MSAFERWKRRLIGEPCLAGVNSAPQPAKFDPVPTGKILIVRYVSAFFAVPNGQRILQVELVFTLDGLGHRFAPLITGAWTGLQEAAVVSEQTYFYVESGTEIQVNAQRGIDFDGSIDAPVVISGELVDA